MYKIALIAGPGAGKTTLANAITAHAKSRGMVWYNVQEYARDFINEHGQGTLRSMGAMGPSFLASRQTLRERRVPDGADGFVTDSPLILPWFYAKRVNDSLRNMSIVLPHLYKTMVISMSHYTHFVIVNREKDYVEDGTRIETEGEAREIDAEVQAEIRRWPVNRIEVVGTTQERVEQIFEALENERTA